MIVLIELALVNVTNLTFILLTSSLLLSFQLARQAYEGAGGGWINPAQLTLACTLAELYTITLSPLPTNNSCSQSYLFPMDKLPNVTTDLYFTGLV